jgi:uncharacterized RDD family membrane protein YckC
VKCPKCGYLGFETGDTCKNCGYDFSLIAPAPILTPDPDLAIRTDDAETGAPELWLDRLDRSMDEVSRPNAKQEHLIGVPEPRPTTPSDPLPLFNPDDPDDIPLIALPTAPRAPLSVRRPAETPRLRAVPKMTNAAAPTLDFHEEARADQMEEVDDEPRMMTRPAHRRPAAAVEGMREVGGRRLVAALIDHTILFAIDAVVVYFTARMAGVGRAELHLLPIVPIAVFLGLLKVSYFTAFTAIGGQTIGKMAVGIKVVAESGIMDSAVAMRRTLAGVVSLLPLGLGLVPAFIGDDRRALHDRLTGTRVVALPSA